MEDIRRYSKSNRVYGDPSKYVEPSYMSATEEDFERYSAAFRVQRRLEKSARIAKQARNLKIKQYAMRVIGAALIVGATFAGTVAAIHYSNNLELPEEPSLEQPMPTEEEFEAGLTQEQLEAKKALDEQANAEIMNNLGMEQQTQGRSL